MDVVHRCDRRMLRYMAGVRWQDRRSSSEVAEMCGVEDLSVRLKQRRLRWFGDVKYALINIDMTCSITSIVKAYNFNHLIL